MMEPLSPVVTPELVRSIAKEFGTPVYVYSQQILEEQADRALAFPNAFGLTVRYAMKSNSNVNFLRIFDRKGIFIDASSGYEADRAIRGGIEPRKILLTGKLIPENLRDLVEEGVEYNICSLRQLVHYGKLFHERKVSVRINPGLGSGHNNRTNTGGESSPFGIWHEYIPSVLEIAKQYGLLVNRIHTHIGSGSDPEIWKKVALMSLENVARFLGAGHPVSILNLGGGYKVARMSYETGTDLQEIGKPVKEAFERFAERTGVRLRLEIEPGTFLVANAGCVIARVADLVSTGKYNFIITDTGMNEVTRPSLYGAQHPISTVSRKPDYQIPKQYLVCGKCCESGDILTPEKGDPEALLPREILEPRVQDLVVVGGAGAYCAGMSTISYNSFLQAPEVLIKRDGEAELIRKRQTLEQMTQNEIQVI